MEKELAGTKSIFKAKRCKELQGQAEQLKTQIANMKQYLSSIVQGYGYKNVKEFLAELKASKAGYTDYQLAVAMWEQQTGKAESDSLKSRLQRKQQEVKERENNRQSHYHRNERGGR